MPRLPLLQLAIELVCRPVGILRLGLAGHNLNLSSLWINLETGDMQAGRRRSFESARHILLSEAGGYSGHGSEDQLSPLT
jgi:hypothetical protein